MMNQNHEIIIDMGCGLNPHKNANYVIDINPIINKLDKNIAKKIYDLNKIPYPFEKDTITEIHCRQLLEHLQTHSFEFLKECHRILKPNGTLYLELPNAFHYSARLKFLYGRYVFDMSFHPFHVKLLKPTYLVEHLRYLGFDIKLKPTTHLWSTLHLEQLFPDLFSRGINIIARKRP